jgi:hypothetical protein
MSPRPDIAIHSAEGKLQLVVEVKGVATTDANWAAQYRRNLLAHRFIPPSPYFLLFAPDSTYLWSSAQNKNADMPAVQGNTKAILARYLPKRDNAISATGLEMAVQSWLLDVTMQATPKQLDGDEKRLLVDSGLLHKINTGSLILEPSP